MMINHVLSYIIKTEITTFRERIITYSSKWKIMF